MSTVAPTPATRVLTRRQRSTLQLRDEGDRTVVLKVLAEDSPSRSELARFTTELQIAGSLDLPGVRRVLRIEDVGGSPALVMEYVEGEPLADRIGAGLPLDRFLSIARQLAEVIAAVHARGVIHRDLSPANVILRPDGSPVLIDFGLAARLDTKVHHLGNPRSLRGTLAYLSPEQTGRMNRYVDHRTDLYALGAIAYHMLTGRPPFVAERPIDLVHAHLALRPVPAHELRADVPIALSRLILRLLQKNADDRYQSAAGVAHDLARIEAGETEFPLGARDASDRLQLPQRLYGREAQAATLLEAFAQAASGHTRLVLVRGAAGAGKSAVVQEVHRDLSAYDACFADGKFDQLQRVPFQAFLQALDAYAAQLLIEPPDTLALWRARIQHAVGDVGGVLTALSPRLEQVLGPQPPLPILSGAAEEQNRFFYVMRSFVAAVARADRPLVLFLDDLQWADVNSIALLKNLVTAPEGQHLLLIGAYRDDEVDGSHPLRLTVDELKRAGAPVEQIEVGELGRDDLAALIGDALRVSRDDAAPLAALVYAKTRGNPFFARRFLVTLHQEGAIRFDHSAGGWTWDLQRCHALDLTDNVVEFMARRAARLDEEPLRVLKIAACVGGRFDLETLSVVAEQPEDALQAALWPALQDGLVLALADGTSDDDDERTYRFAHDRIRQAVYSLLGGEERKDRHARIGLLLLERGSDDRLFDVVNQLNLALDRVTDRRVELARLNTRAGRRAMASAAYEHALRYLTVAAELLPADAWASLPDLCLELHTLRAEAALLSGPDHAAVEDSAGQVIANARAPHDKMPAYDILLQMALLRQEVHQAIEVGLRALRELDVTFPANPNLAHILWALAGTKWALWGRDVASLIDLPPLEDPRVAAVMPMIERICPAAFRVGSNLFPLLTLRLLDLTLKHGNAGTSTFAYGAYGITSCGVLGDIETGYAFGRLAMDLCDRLGADSWRAKSEFMWANFVRHWKEPLQNSVAGNRETYLVGLKTGAMYEAVWGALYEIGLGFHLDSVLPEIERRLDAQADLLAWDGSVAANARLLRQVVGGLAREDTPEPWAVSGRWFDEEAEARAMREGRDHTGLCCYHLYSAWLATLFDRHARALEHLAEARKVADAITSMPFVPILELHDALGHLAAHRARLPGAKVAVAKKAIGRFEKWARFNADNQAHRLALIRAELDRTTGAGNDAPALYDEAIEGAVAARFTQEEARALELAGEFYLERGRVPIAAMYLQRAVDAYARWGAWAKVRQLRESYPEHARAAHRRSSDSVDERPDATMARSSDELDLQSIADAANALSAEIVLEQLIDKLLRITTSNAGAERAALLLTREGSLHLEAQLHHGEIRRGTDEALPWSILHYCERTQESVVLADAMRTGMFRDDPVVQAHRIRSVLCVPLVRSKELLGVVYLDNNLVSDAFTAERGRSVRLLAGQAATSIRNAQLYAHLQRTLDQQVALNHAAARFVPVEFLRSLNRDNLQDVELGDSAQKVMSILFSDIRSFTPLVESLKTSEALLAFINEYLRYAEPGLLDAGGFIDSYNGDGVMALFEDADAAVTGAIEMQRGLQRYNRVRADRGDKPLVTGIGLSTGSVMLGTFGGGTRRMKCGVIGDPVNTAARVESLTKEYKAHVLITGHTRAQLRRADAFALRRVDRIRPVGKTEALVLYQVIDAEPDDVRDLLTSYRDEFEAAMDAFYSRQFEPALETVRRCLQKNPKDAIAWRLAARCESLAMTGVPDDWDGVVQMTHK